MSVLVTGGLGFIGAKVVIQLLRRDIPVIIADLDIEKNKIRLEENIKKIGKNHSQLLKKINHQIDKKIEKAFDFAEKSEFPKAKDYKKYVYKK